MCEGSCGSLSSGRLKGCIVRECWTRSESGKDEFGCPPVHLASHPACRRTTANARVSGSPSRRWWYRHGGGAPPARLPRARCPPGQAGETQALSVRNAPFLEVTPKPEIAECSNVRIGNPPQLRPKRVRRVQLLDAVAAALQTCCLCSHIIRALSSRLGAGTLGRRRLTGIKAALSSCPGAACRFIGCLLRFRLAVFWIGDQIG